MVIYIEFGKELHIQTIFMSIIDDKNFECEGKRGKRIVGKRMGRHLRLSMIKGEKGMGGMRIERGKRKRGKRMKKEMKMFMSIDSWIQLRELF